MEHNKAFFEKVFSTKRMERYFRLYPEDEKRAILHYKCNLELAEAFYTSLSVLEVTLRNALSRELETMTGRDDWYAVFANEMIVVMGWMNRDVPGWLQLIDRFDTVCANIRKNMGW